MKRIVCFALLMRLPDEGLSEIIENLRDAIQFYSPVPAPAVPRQLQNAGRAAVQGKTVERPPLILDEES